LQQTTNLNALKRIRNAITYDLDNCRSMKDRSALYSRLLDTIDRIHAMSQKADGDKPGGSGDYIDEVAKRRSARRSTPRASEG